MSRARAAGRPGLFVFGKSRMNFSSSHPLGDMYYTTYYVLAEIIKSHFSEQEFHNKWCVLRKPACTYTQKLFVIFLFSTSSFLPTHAMLGWKGLLPNEEEKVE